MAASSRAERTDSLNLFFCFRWILISFKREFKFEDVIKLWEVSEDTTPQSAQERWLIAGTVDELLLGPFRIVHRAGRPAISSRCLDPISGGV